MGSCPSCCRWIWEHQAVPFRRPGVGPIIQENRSQTITATSRGEIITHRAPRLATVVHRTRCCRRSHLPDIRVAGRRRSGVIPNHMWSQCPQIRAFLCVGEGLVCNKLPITQAPTWRWREMRVGWWSGHSSSSQTFRQGHLEGAFRQKRRMSPLEDPEGESSP